MANRSKTPVTPETGEATNPEGTKEMTSVIDAPATDSEEVEVPDNDTENTDEVTAEDEIEEIVDFSELSKAVAELIASVPKPLATGEGAMEGIDFTPVVTAYQALSRKSKGAATRELGELSRKALESDDFDNARLYLAAERATKSAKPKSTRAPRVPADVTTPVVDRLAAFQLAFGALKEFLPEGVEQDEEKLTERVREVYDAGQEEIRKLIEWNNSEAEDKGEEPIVSEAVALAYKFAFRGKLKAKTKADGTNPTPRNYPAVRHDVGNHIAQVFADKPSGHYMSAKDIATHESAEYGTDRPALQAVVARFKGKKPLAEGLTVVKRDDNYGVVKA